MPPATLEAQAQPALMPDVQAVIDTAVERLVAEFQPEQIWLFGSHAWGEPRADSDLDLLIVVGDSGDTSIQAIRRARRVLRCIDMAKDLLMQKKSDFDRFKAVRSSLSYKIATEGRLLHGAD